MMGKHTLVALLAAFFHERPRRWVDGDVLGEIAGKYAWRSRASELRRDPWNMTIRNRQRRVQRGDGSFYIVSEYMFEPEEVRAIEEQQDRLSPPLLPL